MGRVQVKQMVLGVGTDILKIQRIRAIGQDGGDSFFQKTFTIKEREQASARPDPVLYFATRFAGKEAVFKSLGIAGDGIRLDEIEILESEKGQPQVALSGLAAVLASQMGIKHLQISLSYDGDYAIAFAVAQDG